MVSTIKKLSTVCALLICTQTVNAAVSTKMKNIDIYSDAAKFQNTDILPPLQKSHPDITLQIQEINQVAGTQGDPLKTLSTLPGVVNAYSSSGAGLNNGFYVRGSDSNDNALWVDGVPIGYAFHLGGLYSVINPDILAELDTYQGGFGVEFGDKLGGAINITTRTPNLDKTEQSLQLGFYDSSYRIEGPLTTNTSAYFAIRRSYFDLLLPPTGTLGNSDIHYTQFPQFWDIQAKLHHRLKNGFIDFSVISSQDQLTLNIDNDGDIIKDPAIAGNLGGDYGFSTYSLNWQQYLNQDWQQQIRFGLLSNQSHRYIGTQLSSDPSPNKPFSKNIDGQNWFLLPQWNYLAGNHFVVKMGIDAYSYAYKFNGYWYQECQEGSVDCNLTRLNKASLNETINGSEISPYIEYKRDITDKLRLTLGLRNSHVSIEHHQLNALSPRLALDYKLSNRLLFNLKWGKFVQKPDFNQLTTALGNPNLSFRQAEHRILGLKYKLSPKWTVQAEVYQKPMIDLISTSLIDHYTNQAKGEAKGFDVLAKREYKNGAFGWISYAYSDSRRTDLPGESSRPFDGDQTHTLSAVWNQPMTGSWNKWRWGTKVNASTGQPYTKVIAKHIETLPDGVTTYWVPNYESTNNSRLPFYFRLDVSMERNWRYQDLNLTTRFELININALVRQNVLGYLYNSDYTEVEKVYGLPFLPSFSIRGTF
ncbi:TonB-dependent receptor [Thiomicrorhabdus hydrogeniphila]